MLQWGASKLREQHPLNRDDESGVGRVLERSYLPVLSKYHTNKATTHNLDKDTSSLLPLSNLLFWCFDTGEHLNCPSLSKRAQSHMESHCLLSRLEISSYVNDSLSTQHSWITLLLHSCWWTNPKEPVQYLTARERLTQCCNYIYITLLNPWLHFAQDRLNWENYLNLNNSSSKYAR